MFETDLIDIEGNYFGGSDVNFISSSTTETIQLGNDVPRYNIVNLNTVDEDLTIQLPDTPNGGDYTITEIICMVTSAVGNVYVETVSGTVYPAFDGNSEGTFIANSSYYHYMFIYYNTKWYFCTRNYITVSITDES